MGLAVVGFSVLVFSGCVKQEASKVETTDKIAVETSADPEFAKAQKLIEEMADSPVGYSRLATLYIKKARETGDFSLNEKAENAVDKALEIKSDDAGCAKIKSVASTYFSPF